MIVSASPPVWWPIGSDPNRCAYIWLSPHGSNRDGISVKSLPAKIRRACPSLKPITTPIASGRRRWASTSACSICGLAAAGDDNLSAGLDDLVGGMQHEVDALLVHEPGNQTENRTARHRETELLADVIGVGLLALPVAGAERLGQLCAGARIPAFVDAVQDAGQFRRVRSLPQQAFEPAAELRRRDLPGVGCADRGEMRGVDDAALEEGQFVVEFETVDVEGSLRCADPAQRVPAGTGPDRRGCEWSGSTGP